MRDRQAPGSFAGTSAPVPAPGARTGAETGFVYGRAAEINEDLPWPGRAPKARRATPPPDASPIGQHCWVIDPARPERPQAGLLVDWRRAPDGWWGRVVLASSTTEGRRTVTDTWMPAARLKPARNPRQ